MQLFGTDLLKTYWAHDVEMTSMRRRYVASTSLRRHVPAGSLRPLAPPNILNLAPPQYSKPSYAYVHGYLETVFMLLNNPENANIFINYISYKRQNFQYAFECYSAGKVFVI